jgi:hypothetical protein
VFRPSNEIIYPTFSLYNGIIFVTFPRSYVPLYMSSSLVTDDEPLRVETCSAFLYLYKYTFLSVGV